MPSTVLETALVLAYLGSLALAYFLGRGVREHDEAERFGHDLEALKRWTGDVGSPGIYDWRKDGAL